MFWKAKPTIDFDDEHWQIETWSWLLKNFGGVKRLKNQRVALPSKTHFPASGQTGEAHAAFVFAQVADWFGVDPEEFELECQEEDINPSVAPLGVVQNAPRNALGTYQYRHDENKKHVVSYAPSLLKNLESLIATFAHEICHPLLFGIMELPPGGPQAEEFATDLAMIFFGFGVFGANASFVFEQFNDNAVGTQGWKVNRAGYLTQHEWGYGLAVRTILTGEDDTLMLQFLSPGAVAHYKKNLKYLQRNAEKLADIAA